MGREITRAVLNGVKVSITTDCWPLRGPVNYILVSATKQTWNGVVTLNEKIPMVNNSEEKVEQEIIHAILEMAGEIDMPFSRKG